MALAVGPDLAVFYNDAFAMQVGTRHPDLFGRPAAEALTAVWGDAEVAQALAFGLRHEEAFVDEGRDLVPDRGEGDREPAHFVLSGSPVHDVDGAVLAMLHVAVETTSAQLRARAVARLATALSVALSVDDVCKTLLREAVSAFDAVSAAVVLPASGDVRILLNALAEHDSVGVESAGKIVGRVSRGAAFQLLARMAGKEGTDDGGTHG